MKYTRFLIVFVVVLFLGCTNTAQTEQNCDELLEARLYQLMFDRVVLDDLLEGIANSKGVSREDLTIESLGSGAVIISWQSGERSYTLDVQDSIPVSLFVFDNARLPIKQALACLGAPDGYLTTTSFGPEGITVMEMSLYYPSKGIEIRGRQTKRGEVDPYLFVNEDMPIDLLVFANPGSMEHFINKRFDGVPLELRAAMLNRIRKWPNEWTSIVIEQWDEIISN